MAEKKKTAEVAEVSPEPEFIEGETSSGLKFKINPNVRDDFRLVRILGRLQKKDIPMGEQVELINDLLELIFGEEGLYVFLNEIAALHNGVANTAVVMQELSEIIEAANLKN